MNACGNKKTATDAPENTTTEQVNEMPKYTSQDGKFSILFPGEPTVSTEKVETEIGTIDMSTFIYEKSSQEAYMVSYADYPAEMIKDVDQMEMLASSRNGVLENIGASVVEEKDITLDGHKGIYFKANSVSLYLIYKMVMVNNRIFQVAIMKEGGYPSDSEADSFIGSFTLTK